MMKKDYYSILGVSKDASKEEIESAYKKMALKYHPDRQHGKTDVEKKDAELKFKECAEAAEVLRDPQKRQNYDRFGTADVGGMGHGPGGFDPMEFFRRHFETGFGGFDFGFSNDYSFNRSHNDPNAPKRGRDVEISLDISFEEAIFGVNKEFDIKFNETCDHCKGTGSEDGKLSTCPTCHGRGMVSQQLGPGFFSQHTCPTCHGSGEAVSTENVCHVCHGSKKIPVGHHINISIPMGVSDGERLRILGEGEHGINGGQNGDLYIRIGVGDNKLFQRSGERGINLSVSVYIPALSVGVVDTIDIPTPYGTRKVKLPKHLNSDGHFNMKISGAGVKKKIGRREIVGDLYVSVIPIAATNLNDEQKKIVEELLKKLSASNTPLVNEYNKIVCEVEQSFEKTK